MQIKLALFLAVAASPSSWAAKRCEHFSMDYIPNYQSVTITNLAPDKICSSFARPNAYAVQCADQTVRWQADPVELASLFPSTNYKCTAVSDNDIRLEFNVATLQLSFWIDTSDTSMTVTSDAEALLKDEDAYTSNLVIKQGQNVILNESPKRVLGTEISGLKPYTHYNVCLKVVEGDLDCRDCQQTSVCRDVFTKVPRNFVLYLALGTAFVVLVIFGLFAMLKSKADEKKRRAKIDEFEDADEDAKEDTALEDGDKGQPREEEIESSEKVEKSKFDFAAKM